jgi:integrase
LLIYNDLFGSVKSASVTSSVTGYMQLNSYLVKSRHGIYYLRIQRNGSDNRVSLRTKNYSEAQIAAYHFGAKIRTMINTKNISGWALKLPDGTELSTEDNPEDRASGLEALRILANSAHLKNATAQLYVPPPPVVNKICLGDAIRKYKPDMESSGDAQKTINMTNTLLLQLVAAMGEDFDMSLFNDASVKLLWLDPRLKAITKRGTLIAPSTVKKELTWVRNFGEWSSHDSRKYCPCPLSLTQAAKNVHREYFNGNDLKLIFDTLPASADNTWRFWIPIISLYTGARIGEPSGLRVDHFSERMGLKIMHLPGTKSECSPRDVPIHKDLIDLGLLDLVDARRTAGQTMLFDITKSSHNGWGAAATKWFGPFLREIGITDVNKVHHSFRHTLIDLFVQYDVSLEARMQYVGHSKGQGSHGMYGRNPVGLPALNERVVSKIEWQTYCGWSPDLTALRAAADNLLTKEILAIGADTTVICKHLSA